MREAILEPGQEFLPERQVTLEGEQAKLARDVAHACDALTVEFERRRMLLMQRLQPLLLAHKVPENALWQLTFAEGHWRLEFTVPEPMQGLDELPPRTTMSRAERRQAVRDARKSLG